MSDHTTASSVRVLIVANSAATLAVLPAYLASKGQTVAVAHQPAEVFSDSHEWLWDVVVIDVTPVAMSLEMARRLHQRQPNLATIVLSSDQRPATLEAAIQANVYEWLVAPCSVELVRAAILRAHEWSRLHRQRDSEAREGRLSSSVLHTVNNQLAGIIGLIQLHMSDETLPPDLRTDLEMMLQSARTAGELLKPLRKD